MKDWFYNLSERERYLVACAAILFVITIVYLFVLQPFQNSVTARDDLQQRQRATLEKLRNYEGRISSGGSANGASAANQRNLVIVVDNTLKRHELISTLKRSKPVDNNTIQLVFENAPFDNLVSWLGELASRDGVSIQSAAFTHRAQAGLVDSTLTLERVR